ncbi:MAG: cytochrome c oxidase assembly factor Coa1 family protein, partial [Pseudomonadota bacterium]
VGSMHVYATALEYVEHHPVIAAELGAPVEARWFPSRGRVSSASGRAEFEIELTGARNDGIATVHSRRRAGTWAVEQAFLKVGGVERTLLAQAAPLGAHDEGGVR